MLTHADLATYVADLTDSQLAEFAARVLTWRRLLLDTGYDQTRWLIVRCLVAISNETADRGWAEQRALNSNRLVAHSPWHPIRKRADQLEQGFRGTVADVREQVAAWARTVRLMAA